MLKTRRFSWIIWEGPVQSQGSLGIEEGLKRESQRDGSIPRTLPKAADWRWRKGSQPRNAGSLWKPGKAKGQILPSSLQK